MNTREILTQKINREILSLTADRLKNKQPKQKSEVDFEKLIKKERFNFYIEKTLLTFYVIVMIALFVGMYYKTGDIFNPTFILVSCVSGVVMGVFERQMYRFRIKQALFLKSISDELNKKKIANT